MVRMNVREGSFKMCTFRLCTHTPHGQKKRVAVVAEGEF